MAPLFEGPAGGHRIAECASEEEPFKSMIRTKEGEAMLKSFHPPMRRKRGARDRNGEQVQVNWRT